MAHHFTIHITSDTICPWCYIGLRRLQSGIRAHTSSSSNASDTFSIRWKPFYLNPDGPKAGIPKKQAYAAKFGEGNVDAMFERMDAVGKSEGIKFDNSAKTGRTYDSHRLIARAGQKEDEQGKSGEGLQTRVVEALFRSYFEEGEDVTSHTDLVAAAVKGGLTSGEVDQVLSSEEFGEEVNKEAEVARRGGVSGVPYFVIDGMIAVEGAQEGRAFEMVFKRIKERSNSTKV